MGDVGEAFSDLPDRHTTKAQGNDLIVAFCLL